MDGCRHIMIRFRSKVRACHKLRTTRTGPMVCTKATWRSGFFNTGSFLATEIVSHRLQPAPWFLHWLLQCCDDLLPLIRLISSSDRHCHAELTTARVQSVPGWLSNQSAVKSTKNSIQLGSEAPLLASRPTRCPPEHMRFLMITLTWCDNVHCVHPFATFIPLARSAALCHKAVAESQR